LVRVEALMRALDEPTRIELSTMAPAEIGPRLLERGYRLLGFENVLVRPLHAALETRASDVRVERVTHESLPAWKQTSIDASAESDDTGKPVDQFSYAVVSAAVEDFLDAPSFGRYLARYNGRIAGAASMKLHGRVALLGGAATLPAWRKRGVQT